MQAVDYAGESRDAPQDSSPTKRAEADRDDDGDTDFQEEKAVSEAEESGNETDVVDVEELRSPAKRRGSRSVYANSRMCFLPAHGTRTCMLTFNSQGTPFKRVHMDGESFALGSPPNSAQTLNGVDNEVTQRSCLACNQPHKVGLCPLKHAGVEHCALCGIAHFGHGRTCPHLNSVTQCRFMLEALKKSTESKPERSLAKRYIVGIINDLNRRKERDEARRVNGTAGRISGRPTSTPAMPNGGPYLEHNSGWPGPPAGQNIPPSYAQFENHSDTSGLPPSGWVNGRMPPMNTSSQQASDLGS